MMAATNFFLIPLMSTKKAKKREESTDLDMKIFFMTNLKRELNLNDLTIGLSRSSRERKVEKLHETILIYPPREILHGFDSKLMNCSKRIITFSMHNSLPPSQLCRVAQ